MDFNEAEQRFQELQARVQRGEPLSEDQYQEELAKMMVQDDRGVFWSLEPGTGRWLFFNGTEWVPGTPPRPATQVETPTRTFVDTTAPATVEPADAMTSTAAAAASAARIARPMPPLAPVTNALTA